MNSNIAAWCWDPDTPGIGAEFFFESVRPNQVQRLAFSLGFSLGCQNCDNAGSQDHESQGDNRVSIQPALPMLPHAAMFLHLNCAFRIQRDACPIRRELDKCSAKLVIRERLDKGGCDTS
jgi:hypothetical protein